MSAKKIHVWIGCTTKARLNKSIPSLEKVLQSLKLNYEFIDRDTDICCGSVLFNTGQRKAALNNAKEKITETFRKMNVQSLVTPCPGCYRTFKEVYPREGLWRFESVKHVGELISEHINEMQFKNKGKLSVTYHDPCHLGRHSGVFEAPRKILSALPNVTFQEMKYNRENSFCCGSGAGTRIFRKELADYASALCLMDAQSTGAKYLVTACPFCEHSLRSAQSSYKIETPTVVNIIDLVSNLISNKK
jgi:Fe-S oxidoreductase